MDDPLINKAQLIINEALKLDKRRGYTKHNWKDHPTNITERIFDDDLDYESDSDGVTWCIWRFGSTCTKLPDGRWIFIAGEYEDYYDPDFYIYNDVIVIENPETAVPKVTVYGYPKSVFAPTDFHEAILIDSYIWILGTLGYTRGHVKDFPIYLLNTNDFTIEAITYGGDPPLNNIQFNTLKKKNRCQLKSEGLIEIQTPTKTWYFDTKTRMFIVHN